MHSNKELTRYIVNRFGLFRANSEHYCIVCIYPREPVAGLGFKEYEFEAEDDESAKLIYEIGGLDG